MEAKYDIGDVVYDYNELVKHQEDLINILNRSLKSSSTDYAGIREAAKKFVGGPEQHTVIGYYRTSEGKFIYYLDDLDHTALEQDVLTTDNCYAMLRNMIEQIKATATIALNLL